MKSIFRIMSATKELMPYYVGIIVCSIAVSITALAAPFVIKGATDTVVNTLNGSDPQPVSIIIWFAVAYFASQLFNTVISNIGGFWGDVMSQKMRTILSNRYYEKLMVLPQSYFDSELTGTIISRLNRSITEITNFVKMFSNSFFTMIITTIAVIAISGWYYWPLALLLVIIFPVYFWLTSKTSEKWQVWEGDKNKNIDIASGRFNEVIGQIRVVKSFGQERRELGLFSSHFAKTIGLTRSQSSYWHRMDVARRGFLDLIFFGLYLMIFVRTLRGDFTIGDMVLLIQLMNMAVHPISSLSWVVDSAQRAIAGSKDYFDVMALDADTRALALVGAEAQTEGVRTSPLTTQPGGNLIAFDRVAFGYEGEANVLENIDLTIKRGEKIAFVGESGGGKSTLMALLEGLYDPREGKVVVDGHDIASADLEQLRSRIGMVFQDASLFSGTIAENIAYSNPHATREQIVAAAQKANAHTFIEKFADGYDSLIGERGLKLSGGQKQRIAVARAILKDAPILILDEATSALDTKAERAVQKGLDELMEGRTSLIIAHRLSTISAVDRIVTLKDGHIDEIGSPAELAASGGIYAELLALQDSGKKSDKKRLQSFDIVS
ncbi:ABC transporter ATP-binding protein [Rothia sp. ZJ1223]|uniref:ABC transporter ATP-binding protein n=1 Tax=Rothia sp. ZJ1223 TaxID=2811098 RepID=UPI00195B04E0|nr:ABC transporter ATP-binding protein [Rothia sp. ZJ1223]MBM7051326.1 ABC transporter ATP-binding protein [Rothia sp. ZJ1223]